MLTDAFYEKERSFLYHALTCARNLQEQNKYLKQIEKLENKYKKQKACIDYLENEAQHVKEGSLWKL